MFPSNRRFSIHSGSQCGSKTMQICVPSGLAVRNASTKTATQLRPGCWAIELIIYSVMRAAPSLKVLGTPSCLRSL